MWIYWSSADIDIGGWAPVSIFCEVIDHVITCQLIPHSESLMGKRKTKSKNLTKIDPSLLKPKPVAISQHVAPNGLHVTTAVNPILEHLVPLVGPLGFDFDPASFDGEHSEDDVTGEDYYAAQVHASHPLPHFEADTVVRMIRSYNGRRTNATHSLKRMSDSKVREYLPTAIVNSAAKKACIDVSIVLPSSCFAEDA